MLSFEDRQSLVAALARLYDFSEGARPRRVLIEQAGLRRFLPGIDLSGTPMTVAADLVGKLERFGAFPERSSHHALGALLAYVLTLSDLPREDARILARIAVVYGLVGDPIYLDKLRAEHAIAEAVVSAGAAGLTSAPAPFTAGGSEPAFAPAIRDEPVLERILDSEDNFLDINLLVGAIYSAAAVCRIENPPGTALGTGFLVGPDLVLTNQHVLKSRQWLEGAVARFDHRMDGNATAAPGRQIAIRGDFYESSPAEAFDYALVRLESPPLGSIAVAADEPDVSMLTLVKAGKHRGYLVVAPRFLKAHDRVNIIQHPDVHPMKVVMTHNYVVDDMTDARVQYVADTMGGSSGSPVFNQNWEVVALHHSGAPYPPESVAATAKKIWKGRYRVNEGIPMRAVLGDFSARGLERHLPRQ